jgi:dUTP pyrophosphatase
MKIDYGDNTLYFSKINPDIEEDPNNRNKNAVIPTKEDENGWYDLYACFDEEELVIPPLETILVPTGIAMACSPKYRMKFDPRGSNTKSKTILNAGCIDSGWRGESFVALVNTSMKVAVISKRVKDVETRYDGYVILFPYSKAICQFAVSFVPKMKEKEVPYSELLQIESKRGTSCLGASGK